MAEQKRKGFHALEEKIHEMEAEDEKGQQAEKSAAGSSEGSGERPAGERSGKGAEKK